MSKPPRLTEARRRVLAYMRDTGCRLARAHGHSTAWTSDLYQWPVATAVVEAMIAAKLIQRDPRSNEYEAYAISAAGLRALDQRQSGEAHRDA